MVLISARYTIDPALTEYLGDASAICPDEANNWTTGAIIMLTLLFVIVGICLIASAADIYLRNHAPKPQRKPEAAVIGEGDPLKKSEAPPAEKLPPGQK